MRRIVPVLLLVVLSPAIPEVSAQEAVARVREIPVVAPAEVGMSAEKLKAVDETLRKLVKDTRLAGVTVVVARQGKICYFETFGEMDREANRPMTRDAIHRIYSMSKAITCAAVMVLVDEGKVRLSDPVSKYVPEMANLRVNGEEGPRKPSRPVTVEDLMLHTAGFGYDGGGNPEMNAGYAKLKLSDRSLSLEEFSQQLAKVPSHFDPGTKWLYGVSIDVLGRVVEVASEQPFDEFLQKRILDPLDMRDTGFHVPADKVDRLTVNYNSDGEGKLTVKDPAQGSQYLTKPGMLSGGGGLVSTARDYVRFLEMIRRGGELYGTRILSEDAVELMTTNQLPKAVDWISFGSQVRTGVGFGCGFCVRVSDSEWDPAGHVGEFGWGGAASTHYWVSPKDDLTVVTLEQTMPYSFLTEFAVKGLIYDAIEE